ncbi:MAG: signal peptidase I [Candidatus Hydrogenedentes bacterium]|nr:signal peptidase I [Candidatus Hydrogenedentota bacterium]
MSGKKPDTSSPAAAVLRPIASAIQAITGPWTRENGWSWIKLIVFVLTVWWFFIQPFRIPSQSMFPTLNGDPGFFTGDRVFVNKLAFGPRIPFTTTRLWNMGHPRRFDVVVFRAIDDDSPRDTFFQRTMNFFLPKVLIKRVIGLPGEHVHIAGGKMYINGKPLELPDNMTNLEFPNGQVGVKYTNEAPLQFKIPTDKMEADIRRENGSEDDVNFMRVDTLQYLASPNSMKYGCIFDDKYSVVPPGHYLCLGDNSASSKDSRYFGWVPEDWMFGRAFCVWWPFKHRKDLSGFTDTFSGMLLLIGIPGLLLGYEFIIRPFVAVAMRVRGEGLSGALQRGDRVIINRLAYGLRRPFSDKRITAGRPANRGEVVAYFVPSGDDTQYSGEALLGRIAGLPGDAITVESGVIFVNGQSTGVKFDSGESGGTRIKRTGNVPQTRYLILTEAGDTAPDSRTLGFIAHDLLIGPATRIWWPPQRMRSLASR